MTLPYDLKSSPQGIPQFCILNYLLAFRPGISANSLLFPPDRDKMRKSNTIPFEKGGIPLKRRIFALALCFCLALGLALTARADSAASSIQIYASVNEDGLANVTMTVRLRIEQTVDSLYFPLPLEATDIKLNDSGVNATRGTSSTQIRLGKDITDRVGDHVLTFVYKIPNVVKMVEDPKTQKSNLTLNLPLLCGFEYPVQSVNLTVMLPEDVQGRPIFKSTYHQDDIDSILNVSINSNMITGLITQQLKDRETLSMTMVVPESMFDGVNTYVRKGNPEVIPMVICALIALVYWSVFLRGYPLLRERRNSPPEGITGGELSTRLTMAGADLTAMVFSWAQMGYLLIQLDDRGRVWLHKRMDMGNERNAFEVKTFRALFSRRETVEGTGLRYAELAQKVAQLNPGRKILNHPKSGNTTLFRIAFAAVNVFCGICYAMNFTGMPALQVVLSILLGALGAAAAWYIQAGMFRLHLRYKLPVIVSAVLAVLWVLLGVWAGPWGIGLLCVLGQVLAGLMAAYGGRRTDLGRSNATQILGYRSYLKKVDREELKRIQENDPEYFYNQLPFALALGVEMAFARRFGKKKMPACPYFICGVKNKMTAEEWTRFFQETAEILDSRYRRLEMEKFAVMWLR